MLYDEHGFLARLRAHDMLDDINDSGATAIEYALIAGFIALAIVSALRVFSVNTSNMFGKISAAI